MKRNKTYLIMSSIAGLIAFTLWILRFTHPEISVWIPLTMNTFQLGFLGLIKN